MKSNIRQIAFTVLGRSVSVVLLALLCATVFAQDFDKTALDVDLLDQSGDRVNLYSDLIEGRAVAVAFCFTTDSGGICPPVMANFSRLEKRLAEEGIVASLIFITVDPVVDTPERLKAFGAKFDFKGTFVTGESSEIESLLKHLLVYTPDKNDLAPVILIGGGLTESWVRVYGLTSTDLLIGKVREVSGRKAHR